MKQKMKFKDKISQLRKKPISLRRRLLILIVIAWIVPVSILFIFITLSYRNNIIYKTEELMKEELINFTSSQTQNIDEAIQISKETSYEQVIEDAWKKYKAGKLTEATFYKYVTGNLKSKYYNDNRFGVSVFYLCDNPDRIYYTQRKDISNIDNYIGKVKEEAMKITNQDTSDAYVRIIDGKIYIIRNLYTTTKYTKFGTLIVELNTDRLFDGISVNRDYEIGFYVDNTESMINYDIKAGKEEGTFIIDELKQEYSNSIRSKMTKHENNSYIGLIYQKKYNDYHMGSILIADKSIIYSELKRLTILIVLILMVVIPVFVYMLYFITLHITTPIGIMIKASHEIEKGNIGMKIEGNPMPNEEFTVLKESFNKMSAEVKYLFDFANSEELARKEAKIISLQSQINPHFLNNTLEMMNWQARMNGNAEISKMIEALGTLLDYSMDRSNKKLIYLSEELRCADAYFYIISMRFGQRLRVEKEVDQELLQIQVPQLILQPILENAVVHGVELVKSGMIKLKVFRENDNVILQVINTGKGMTSGDIEKVNNILAGKEDSIASGTGKHVSLGIRNVNERIKLIYGEEYGLTILPIEGTQETVSAITIPYENKDNMDKRTLLKNLLNKS